ncbi:Ubiquitinyl hydrolase 1 [Bertholletia excelsa]
MLFPGGNRRPKIKVPNLMLQLSCEEVLEDGSVLDVVDDAVSWCVGIVVLTDGVGGGGKLYKAACKVKSIIRERAYLVIAESSCYCGDFVSKSLLMVIIEEPLFVLAAEYQFGSPILQEKIKVLSEHYVAIKRTKGDGNCFFRSFMCLLVAGKQAVI